MSGLAKCIEFDLALTPTERLHCLELKQQGRRLYEPSLGGSYAVFGERPLKEEVMKYCVQDVCILPVAWNTYSKKMSSIWRQRVLAETVRRIQETKSLNYDGKGRHMAEAPTSFMSRAHLARGIVGQEHVLKDADIGQCLRIMSGEGIADTQKLKSQGSNLSWQVDFQSLIDSFDNQKLE